MSKDEKIQFVKSVTAGITEKMIANIESGKVPENWGGIKLRLWIAARFEMQFHPTAKEIEEFTNDLIVYNL